MGQGVAQHIPTCILRLFPVFLDMQHYMAYSADNQIITNLNLVFIILIKQPAAHAIQST